ncbi:hypothetical protein DIPPA_07757 [Diplonema papillatum]|nr:hypothetical protein DIPPA_07757 [Diplonema papillatum]
MGTKKKTFYPNAYFIQRKFLPEHFSGPTRIRPPQLWFLTAPSERCYRSVRVQNVPRRPYRQPFVFLSTETIRNLQVLLGVGVVLCVVNGFCLLACDKSGKRQSVLQKTFAAGAEPLYPYEAKHADIELQGADESGGLDYVASQLSSRASGAERLAPARKARGDSIVSLGSNHGGAAVGRKPRADSTKTSSWGVSDPWLSNPSETDLLPPPPVMLGTRVTPLDHPAFKQDTASVVSSANGSSRRKKTHRPKPRSDSILSSTLPMANQQQNHHQQAPSSRRSSFAGAPSSQLPSGCSTPLNADDTRQRGGSIADSECTSLQTPDPPGPHIGTLIATSEDLLPASRAVGIFSPSSRRLSLHSNSSRRSSYASRNYPGNSMSI